MFTSLSRAPFSIPRKDDQGSAERDEIAMYHEAEKIGLDGASARAGLADLTLYQGHVAVERTLKGAFAEAELELEVCLKRRGEVTALFLDESPTYHLFPRSITTSARTRGPEESSSQGFLPDVSRHSRNRHHRVGERCSASDRSVTVHHWIWRLSTSTPHTSSLKLTVATPDWLEIPIVSRRKVTSRLDT